jgi:hypothetical protein
MQFSPSLGEFSGIVFYTGIAPPAHFLNYYGLC